MHKKVNGKTVKLTQSEENKVIEEWAKEDAKRDYYKRYLEYKDKRAENYPLIGEQLDAIWKQLAYMQMTIGRKDLDLKEKVAAIGNLVTAADNIMVKWLEVKRRYPKPEGVE